MTEEYLFLILKSYGMEQPVITFIRHNENRTYKVDDEANGNAFLMRIHQPFKPSMAGPQHTYDGLLSELEMLEALALEGQIGLRVQAPIRNQDGDLVTVIEYEGQSLNCSLLTWLEGRDLEKEDLMDAEFVTKVGADIAELHSFFRGYRATGLDKRPSQGIEYNNKLVITIKRGYELGLFTASDVQVIEDSIRLINARLEEQGDTTDYWGLIHGDLSLGNILVTPDGKMSFIDFGFFGPGYYLLDVAMGAMMIPTEHRGAFLGGYYGQSHIPQHDMILIEGFMLIAIIGYYAFQMENEAVHPWMRERMPVLCAKYGLPFLSGERIFYSV